MYSRAEAVRCLRQGMTRSDIYLEIIRSHHERGVWVDSRRDDNEINLGEP